MALTQEEIKAVDKLIETAKNRNYKDETIETLLMLPFTEDMEENFGEPLKALTKITELIQQCKNSQECLERSLALLGYNI